MHTHTARGREVTLCTHTQREGGYTMHTHTEGGRLHYAHTHRGREVTLCTHTHRGRLHYAGQYTQHSLFTKLSKFIDSERAIK